MQSADLAALNALLNSTSGVLLILAWRAIRAGRRSAPPLAVGDLGIDGRDLMGLGLKPGPFFGDILEELLDWVLSDPDRNERDGLLLKAEALARKLDEGAVASEEGAG